MEIVIVLVGSIIAVLLVYYVFEIDIKKIKGLTKNDRIKELTDRFPENEEICKTMLNMINNPKVKIKQSDNEKDKTCLYIAISDTIFIANINDVYARIQTIAHECMHSIQSRKLLLFNFIFTNIYNLYFILSIILTIFGVFKNINIQIIILFLMSIISYIVRAYLEMDAMIKAKYLADDYMKKYIQENKVCSIEEVNEITKEHENINKYGIPTYNAILFFKSIIRIIIYVLVGVIIMSGRIN